MTSNLEQLKKKIQEAIPEIMELKFGCEVAILFDDSDFYGKVDPQWIKAPIYRVSEKKAVIYAEWKYSNGINVEERLASKTLRILGRPIRLADVLLALGEVKREAREDGFDEVSNMERVVLRWNLKDDNLDNQSPETINFLWGLLCKQ